MPCTSSLQLHIRVHSRNTSQPRSVFDAHSNERAAYPPPPRGPCFIVCFLGVMSGTGGVPTRSWWLDHLDSGDPAAVGALPSHADVVVIGAGFTGCVVAYHLGLAGAGTVVVLDSRGLGAGATGRNGDNCGLTSVRAATPFPHSTFISCHLHGHTRTPPNRTSNLHPQSSGGPRPVQLASLRLRRPARCWHSSSSTTWTATSSAAGRSACLPWVSDLQHHLLLGPRAAECSTGMRLDATPSW